MSCGRRAARGRDSGGGYVPSGTPVRVEDRRVLVSVVLASGSSVRSLEAQVRSALAPHVEGRQVDVHVADVQTAMDVS